MVLTQFEGEGPVESFEQIAFCAARAIEKIVDAIRVEDSPAADPLDLNPVVVGDSL